MSAPRAHLTAFLAGVGYHESAWKLADPADLTAPAWFGVLERAALAAERGLLDAVFFADSPGLEIFRARYFPQVGFDPLELLAALSPHHDADRPDRDRVHDLQRAVRPGARGWPPSTTCPAGGPAGTS